MADVPDRDFLHRCDATLLDLVTQLDRFDPDELEADASAGVLRITFADGKACIVNRQAAASQLWVAEGAQAWHFAWDGNSWRDTKGRGTLTSVLSEILSRRLGRLVQL